MYLAHIDPPYVFLAGGSIWADNFTSRTDRYDNMGLGIEGHLATQIVQRPSMRWARIDLSPDRRSAEFAHILSIRNPALPDKKRANLSGQTVLPL